MKIELKGINALETEMWVTQQGFDAYRGRQIRHWIFKRLVTSFDSMANIPQTLREGLKRDARLNHLKKVDVLQSKDGTRKYLFRCRDGRKIESVLIPERDHFTLCVSTQAGCAMGCRFCLTAKQGLKRNLSAAEIVEQAILVKADLGDPFRLTNMVMMGMGEPLDNYRAVSKALENIVGEDALNFSHRKVTVSTCGLVPQIRSMGRQVSVNLAVSLNAADNETRNFLMPINRKYPLEALISACRDFPLPNRRMITFEYILIHDINDHQEDAMKLASLLSGLRAKINLILFNPHPGSDMLPPSMKTVEQFQACLIKEHLTAIVRKSRGSDILAACGQLSGSFDDKRSNPNPMDF